MTGSMETASIPWYRSRAGLWLTILLVPPAGLALLWMRTGTSVGRKILGSLVVAAAAVTHLVFWFGLHMELDGTGMRPIFAFGKREAHYQSIEQSRQEQRQSPEPAGAASLVETKAVATSQPAASEPASAEASWTDYRGPARDGRSAETILTKWPAQGLPRLWRQPSGGGYASLVVAGGRVFTIEQRRRQEVVAAYHLETGRELWSNSWDGEFTEGMGGDGPRATPTWHDGRLYALGAEGELRCLDAATGKVLWSKNILRDNQAENLTWAMSASPLVVDDKLIVLPGGSPGRSVAAYDRLTGKPVWKVLDDKQAYTAPMLVTLAGRRQILVVSAQRVMGLGVEDGAVLWDFPWVTEYDANCSQPIVAGPNRFFLSAGYGHGAAVVEIARAGEKFSARAVWQNIRMKNKFNSSVLHEGHVYGLDEGILACVDVETGEQRWKSGRYGYGQLLAASGHLVVLTEEGEVVLVKATPQRHEEVARFSAIEGKTWNVPAIAGGRLLVRNTTELACFRIAP